MGKTRPAMFAPISLAVMFPKVRITSAKQEPLQDITVEDIRAEGVTAHCHHGIIDCYDCYGVAWIKLWNSINGKKPGQSWRDNPTVCAYGFEVVR
jgi:hypothetical protein